MNLTEKQNSKINRNMQKAFLDEYMFLLYFQPESQEQWEEEHHWLAGVHNRRKPWPYLEIKRCPAQAKQIFIAKRNVNIWMYLLTNQN